MEKLIELHEELGRIIAENNLEKQNNEIERLRKQIDVTDKEIEVNKAIIKDLEEQIDEHLVRTKARELMRERLNKELEELRKIRDEVHRNNQTK